MSITLLLKKYYSWIITLLQQAFAKQLKKLSYVHIEEFTRPYIIRKNIEGVDFLLSIRDQHARLWYDLYSKDPVWIEMRFIKDNLVRPGDVVIECGSHHGCTTIMLANWVGPKGAIYAYEPGKRNFEVLKENIVLNGISNIIPINEVVGNDNSLVNFIEFTYASMGSKVDIGKENYSKDQAIRYEIRQISLDKYASFRPSLIKIDTQGYVYEPLLGARELIKKQKPNLALEIDSKAAISQYGNNFEKIFEIIEQKDYMFFIQFESSEEPEQIEFSKILLEWEKRNRYSKEIHLFAKNSKG
jgi:FkbM family methyltransferase